MRLMTLIALCFLVACPGPETFSNCPEGEDCRDAGVVAPPADAGEAPAADAGEENPVDAGQAAPDAGQITPTVDAGGGGVGGDDICAIHAEGYFMTCDNGYCHGRAQDPPGGLQVDNSSPAALYNSLVTNGEGSSRLFLVVESNPAMSYLLNKLKGTQDDVAAGGGERMPRGGEYLSDDQIAHIERWIAAGASADCP